MPPQIWAVTHTPTLDQVSCIWKILTGSAPDTWFKKNTYAIIHTRQEIEFIPYVGFLIYETKKTDICKIQEYVGQVFLTDPV